MRIAICEDNIEQRMKIRQLIKNYKSKEITRIDEYHNGESLISQYKNGDTYDIIFLDIEMENISGIQVAEIIGEMDHKVLMIIVTSVLEYAIEGYGVNAFDFVLKPINEKRFMSIVDRAFMKKRKDKNNVYKIESRNRTQYLPLSQIFYIESDKRRVNIFYKEQVISSNESISSVEKKLKNTEFIRISRFYLLNVANIKEIGVCYVILKNGQQLKYSKKHEEAIKNKYMNYMIGEELWMC